MRAFQYRCIHSTLALMLVLSAAQAFAQTSSTPHEVAAQPESVEQRLPAADFLRVSENEDGSHVRLEVASKAFERETGPRVWLVGAVHVGDKSYYEQLQKLLDSNEIVLFERVKPPSDAKPEADGKSEHQESGKDSAAVKATRNRIRVLAVVIERYRRAHQQLPGSLDEVAKDLKGSMERLASVARKDRWGREIRYLLKPSPDAEGAKAKLPGFDLVSLGSDGNEGGESDAADLRFSDQKALSGVEISEDSGGIQVQLARALGLEFQLDSLDYAKPFWRNSDITADDLQGRLEKAGIPGNALFGLLDGSSIGGKLAGFMLKFIEQSPALALQVKVMMVETLAGGDRLLAKQMGAMGGGAAGSRLMSILIEDRNAIVMNDLAALIRDEPKVRTVAIFYGAGHLLDMEKRLSEMGYQAKETKWLAAIDVDVSKTPGGIEQARRMREMIKRMQGPGESQ
jgi:hypothetical protein